MRNNTGINLDDLVSRLSLGLSRASQARLRNAVFSSEIDCDGILAQYAAFARAVRRSLPLRLESLCRKIVLKTLPQGLVKRDTAIEQLTMLPKSIKDLLYFCDFQPSHGFV